MASHLSTETTDDVVKCLVDSGRFKSPKDVISEGVRLLDEREARFAALDQAIAEADEDAFSGNMIDAEAVFAELRLRYKTL